MEHPTKNGGEYMGANEHVIAAFSEEQAARLTGVSLSQLRYWDRIDFYRSSVVEKNRRVAFSRIYSFKDILALRVLNVLRNQYGVSLHHLRDVKEKLGNLAEERWTGPKLYVVRKRVVWHEPETKLPQEIANGQYIVSMDLSAVLYDAKHNFSQMNKRKNSKHGLIERNRFVNHNSPVIAGTRIPVGAIKRFAQAGYNTAQILLEYPDLTTKDVEAALAYSDSRNAA